MVGSTGQKLVICLLRLLFEDDNLGRKVWLLYLCRHLSDLLVGLCRHLYLLDEGWEGINEHCFRQSPMKSDYHLVTKHWTAFVLLPSAILLGNLSNGVGMPSSGLLFAALVSLSSGTHR